MLYIVTVRKVKSKRGLFSQLFKKHEKPHYWLERLYVDDICVRHLLFEEGEEGVNWREIGYVLASIQDSEKEFIFQDGLIPPEALRAKCFRPDTYNINITLRQGIYAAQWEQQVCLFDRAGIYSEWAERLVQVCGDVRVVTDNLAAYNEVWQRVMLKYGAPMTIGESSELCSGCGVVIVPEERTEQLPVKATALVFMKEPAKFLSQHGKVILPSKPKLCKAWQEILPQGISNELFATWREGQNFL